MTVLVMVHGHGADNSSFSYIKHYLENYEIMCLSYDSEYGFESNLLAMSEKVANISDKIIFIGHSLGGVYAGSLAVMFPEKTLGGVTLATPWGGSAQAVFFGMIWPTAQVFSDIMPMSWPIKTLQKCKLPGDWYSVVTTKGRSRFILGDNDGVVSKSSMMSRLDVEYIEVEATHMGVLLSQDVVEIIWGVIALLTCENLLGEAI